MVTLRRLLPATLIALAACGGGSLSVPESLPIRSYAPFQDINLSLVMKSCSDTCLEYEAGTCNVTTEKQTIKLSIDLPYKEKSGVDRAKMEGCSIACGPTVLAHCSVGQLEPGTYTVSDGNFSAAITVQ